jgi:hypothetical protein
LANATTENPRHDWLCGERSLQTYAQQGFTGSARLGFKWVIAAAPRNLLFMMNNLFLCRKVLQNPTVMKSPRARLREN